MSSQPCRLNECTVATTGKCHLGNDPIETCPNYANQDLEIDEAYEQDAVPEAKSEPVSIASGDVMHLEDLAEFTRAHRVQTVALVGERKAGKTTLLASIYAMFLKGPYAGLSFAGSVTLVGFAKRHYLALLNSGRTDPTTPRTSRSDPPSFFHLALSGYGPAPLNLIIADRSGEAYGDARISTELISDLRELQLADRICFLLDGARLASKDSRAAYARQFKQMIHALHDNGALARATAIEVLATKFDDLNKRDDAADQLQHLTDYEKSLTAEFSERGLKIECFRVCALPKKDRTIGFVGLEETVARWSAPPAPIDLRPKPMPDAQRQIDRLFAKDAGAVR